VPGSSASPEAMPDPGLSPLAAAMAGAVSAAPTLRVRLTALVEAARAVDLSGPGRPDWRRRVAAAIHELVDAGLVTYPSTAWDRRTLPHLPEWVEKPRRDAPTGTRPRVVWHARLSWVPALERVRRFSAAERGLLEAVNGWLPSADRALVVPMRERSWQLVGDDRAIEELRSGRLFAADRLSLELLRCRPTWPPVHQRILGPGRWLLVENWSTYESLCAAAVASAFDGRIVFASGNQVGTRLEALAHQDHTPTEPIAYFGDLDPGGIRAARLAVDGAYRLGWPEIRPAEGLYQLAFASPHRLRCDPLPPGTARWAHAWFGSVLADQVVGELTAGRAVRQEAVGLEILSGKNLEQLILQSFLSD
jgi:hypothetical protein